MTRAEKALQREQRLKDQLAAATRQRTQLEAQERARRQQDINKRRYVVGALADEAGLFKWSNADLAALFTVLANGTDILKMVSVLKGVENVDMHRALRALAGYVADPGLLPPPLGELDVIELQPGRTPPPTGIVYVLQMLGHPWLKIGHTKNGLPSLRKRLAYLQIGCPQPLRILQAYACEMPESLEYHVHRCLEAVRQDGEWFATDLGAIDAAVRTLWKQEWEQEPVETDGYLVEIPLTAPICPPSPERNLPIPSERLPTNPTSGR